MRRKIPGQWHDRAAWTLALLGLILMLVPAPAKRRAALPLQTVLLAPIRGFTASRATVSQLRKENEHLARLAAELAVENARLRARAGVGAETGTDRLDMLRAPVIVRDLTTLERYLVISRGSNLGVRRGAPVITPEGLVGKVVAAGRHQALVQTILDPESRVAVLNSRSRIPALARPAGRRLLALDYVPKESDNRPGDTVITAGIGGVFPKGLPVGIVVSAVDRPDDMFGDLQVDPLADFSRLEWVYVVGVPGPAELEDDEWLDNLGPHEMTIPGESRR